MLLLHLSCHLCCGEGIPPHILKHHIVAFRLFPIPGQDHIPFVNLPLNTSPFKKSLENLLQSHPLTDLHTGGDIQIKGCIVNKIHFINLMHTDQLIPQRLPLSGHRHRGDHKKSHQ